MPAPTKTRRGLKTLNSFDKSSRIVHFGDALLKNGLLGYTDCNLKTENTVEASTRMTVSDIRVSNKKESGKQLSKRVEEQNNLQPTNFSKLAKGFASPRVSGRRSPQSYSRGIFDLDYDRSKLESTLDDPGVFRTDGVGGTSVSLTSAKGSLHHSLQEASKPFKMIRKQNVKSSRPKSLSAISSCSSKPVEIRASSVRSVPEIIGRNRSKSDSHSLNSVSHLNGKSKGQTKNTLKSILKTAKDTSQTETLDTTKTNAWAEKKVVTVTIATQTDEEFLLELADEDTCNFSTIKVLWRFKDYSAVSVDHMIIFLNLDYWN